jgi:PTS system galactitol-specific IIA component
MLSSDLCVAGLSAPSSDAVLQALAERLVRAGHVRPSFLEAAIKRERRSPTGLPFPGCGVALPHADPEHVVTPAIAIATLAQPISFRQMGTPGTKLDVRLVVMPALTVKEQAMGELARIMELLQDEPLRRALLDATDSDAMMTALSGRLGAR